MLTASSANIPSSEEYPHHADLDVVGNVILFWKFNETHITFEVSNSGRSKQSCKRCLTIQNYNCYFQCFA